MAILPDRSFRVTAPRKYARFVEEFLVAEGFRFEPEPFSALCHRLVYEPFPLGSSLAAFFGLIYVQDRSAMLPPLALSPRYAALDVCASPGGKAGFMAQLAGDEAFILANEPNPARRNTLVANLAARDLPNVSFSAYAGEKLPLKDASWPYILLDPPCSGWGTENKHKNVRKIWSGDKARKLVGLQRSLLKKAAELLSPGGVLLYSTCTTNYDENEAQTAFAENELGLTREVIPPFPGFAYEWRPGGVGCLLVDGKASRAQGFYLSLLRKPGVAEPPATGGELEIFGEKARYCPAGARKLLPESFKWRAAVVGKMRDGELAPEPRARKLAEKMNLPPLVFDTPGEIKNLLSGAETRTKLDAPRALLCWRDLPLGVTPVKDGRITPAFR